MYAMLESFELKKKSEDTEVGKCGYGLESTDLFKYFQSGGKNYTITNDIESLFLGKDIKVIIDSIARLLSKNKRFNYGFIHTNAYVELNVSFEIMLASEFDLTGISNKKRQLISVIKEGPGRFYNRLCIFLEVNKRKFKQACLDGAVIKIACEALSHKASYAKAGRVERIEDIISKCDNGTISLEEDKDSIERLLTELRSAPKSEKKNLLIKVHSSRFTMTSFVIVGEDWIRSDSKRVRPESDYINPKWDYHFGYCEFNVNNDLIFYFPNGDSFDMTKEEYLESVKFAEDDLKTSFESLCSIKADGLEKFASILGFEEEEESTFTKSRSAGEDDSAFFYGIV